MVQIQTRGFISLASVHERHHKYADMQAREYWMLENEANGTLKSKMDSLNRHGAQCSISTPRPRLEKLCQRAERGLLIYDKLPVSELRGFVHARRLDTTTHTRKADLIHALEQADDSFDVAFRFLDLPAELRVRIYTYHLESLSTMRGRLVTLPPITRTSKLLRTESLPLFYRKCTFHLVLNGPNTYPEVDRYFSMGRAAGIHKIRKLYVVWHSASGFAYSFKLEIGKDGRMKEMPKIECSHPQAHPPAHPTEALLRKFYQNLESRHDQAASSSTAEIQNSTHTFMNDGLRLRSFDLKKLHKISSYMLGLTGQDWMLKYSI